MNNNYVWVLYYKVNIYSRKEKNHLINFLATDYLTKEDICY